MPIPSGMIKTPFRSLLNSSPLVLPLTLESKSLGNEWNRASAGASKISPLLF